jgi:DivIVA domain-containing protein
MIDLTPLDVRKKRGDFRRVLRGYDPGEVDTFLELVESRLETLVMDNLSLTEKTQRLAEQLRALESRERAIQEALVTAQKLREEVQTQSQREADSLLKQANREAESLLEQARREVESLRGEAARESSTLRDEAIREAASLRDQARREVDVHRKEVVAEIEARILEADGLVMERQRALEELERNRRKFLKGFRTLLEREMDAVEVEESRRPLEDNAVEITLRGWSWEDKEGGEGESGEENLFGESVTGEMISHAYEPILDLDAPAGEEGGAVAAEGPGTLPGDEPPEGEFSDIVPVGVFDAPFTGEDPAPSEPVLDDLPDESPAIEDSGDQGEEEAEAKSEEEAEARSEEEAEAKSEEKPEAESEEEPEAGSEEQSEKASEDVFDGQGNWGVDSAFGAAVGDLLTSKMNRDPAWGSEPLWLSSLLEQEAGMEGRGKVQEDDEKSGGEPGDSSKERREGDQEDDPSVG